MIHIWHFQVKFSGGLTILNKLADILPQQGEVVTGWGVTDKVNPGRGFWHNEEITHIIVIK